MSSAQCGLMRKNYFLVYSVLITPHKFFFLFIQGGFFDKKNLRASRGLIFQKKLFFSFSPVGLLNLKNLRAPSHCTWRKKNNWRTQTRDEELIFFTDTEYGVRPRPNL